MSQKFPITSAQQLTAYVRALRKSRGQTQADIALLLGVSTMRVATIEKDVGRLSTKSLINLLQLLGARLELETELTADRESTRTKAQAAQSETRVTPETPKKSRRGEW